MTYENYFLSALILTLIVEVPVLYVYVKYVIKSNQDLHTLIAGIVASVLTLPYFWFVLPVYITNRGIYMIIGESLIVFVEAVIYFRFLKIKFSQALVVSFMANAASILVGLLVF